jgi:hypothetical protein
MAQYDIPNKPTILQAVKAQMTVIICVYAVIMILLISNNRE